MPRSKRRSEKRQGRRANASAECQTPKGTQQPSPQGVSGTRAAPYAQFQGCPGAGDGGAGGRSSPGCAAIAVPGSGMRWSWDTAPSCCPMSVPGPSQAPWWHGADRHVEGLARRGWSPLFWAGAVVALAAPRRSKDLQSPAGLGRGCQVLARNTSRWLRAGFRHHPGGV